MKQLEMILFDDKQIGRRTGKDGVHPAVEPAGRLQSKVNQPISLTAITPSAALSFVITSAISSSVTSLSISMMLYA